MKKRTLLTLTATFGLAASTPVTVPAAENTARIERMVAASAQTCSRAHIDGYTTQLRAVFMTQQPRAIEKLEQRVVTICLDVRLGAMGRTQSDRDAIRYLRSWDQFSLPAGSTYAHRPQLFNAIVDASRTTLWERRAICFQASAMAMPAHVRKKPHVAMAPCCARAKPARPPKDRLPCKRES